MTNFSEIKGFLFDLDGVIADTAKFHGQAWRQVADKVGTPWTDELAEGLKGISRMDSLQLILEASGQGDAYSDAEKAVLADEKNRNYQTLIATLTEADILPGMKAFITDAKAAGYLLSIASASKNAPLILEHLGLTDYFVGIVDPATLAKGKPDPEIFVRAAEILSLPPEQTIGLEDSTSGIEAINAAGAISLGIGDPNVLSAADLNFATTADVTLEKIATLMGE